MTTLELVMMRDRNTRDRDEFVAQTVGLSTQTSSTKEILNALRRDLGLPSAPPTPHSVRERRAQTGNLLAGGPVRSRPAKTPSRFSLSQRSSIPSYHSNQSESFLAPRSQNLSRMSEHSFGAEAERRPHTVMSLGFQSPDEFGNDAGGPYVSRDSFLSRPPSSQRPPSRAQTASAHSQHSGASQFGRVARNQLGSERSRYSNPPSCAGSMASSFAAQSQQSLGGIESQTLKDQNGRMETKNEKRIRDLRQNLKTEHKERLATKKMLDSTVTEVKHLKNVMSHMLRPTHPQSRSFRTEKVKDHRNGTVVTSF